MDSVALPPSGLLLTCFDYSIHILAPRQVAAFSRSSAAFMSIIVRKVDDAAGMSEKDLATGPGPGWSLVAMGPSEPGHRIMRMDRLTHIMTAPRQSGS